MVGALLALASGKAERRQVHPLTTPLYALLLQKYTKNWRKRNFCAC
ncbi:hypothetical protein HMPREF0673_02608 [Leyella stercorea DSM 18206]|uniref:Uncharacterized protein n=1 Tax=Leyella stercorea DSM 18206 TaxID=1002367 RepID=G6B138_9BACT|nr:hypothetical protein HMPREF0673_02608 [Leyella stercorea DSM 18206]